MKKISILLGLIAGLAGTGWGAEPLRLDWGDLDTSGAVPQRALRALRSASPPGTVQALSVQGTAGWLVQFDDVIEADWTAALELAGAQIKGYMPENGFLFWAAPEDIPRIAALEHVTWVGEFLPEYKRAAQVRAKLAAVKGGAESDAARPYRVLLFSEGDLSAVVSKLEMLTGQAVAVAEGDLIQADLTAADIEEVTRWGEVQWVEVYTRPRLWNNVATRTGLMNVSNVWSDLGLTGAGQTVAVCDTGLDTGNTNTIHQDFTGRVLGFGWSSGGYSSGYSWADSDSHGTHVSGSVLGSGAMSSGQYRGVAYAARLIIQGTQADLSGIPNSLGTLFRQAFTNGARIHSDSWGYEGAGAYNTDSRAVDQFVWSNQTFLILVAAGNSGVDANSDGVIDSGSVASPATAKNCLAVGAAETDRLSGGYAGNTWGSTWPLDYPASPISGDYISRPLYNGIQGLAAFSSRGPCLDGRIKPDLVAPGTDIISTRSRKTSKTGWGTVSGNTNYLYMGGTSMATPLMAGAAALTRQWVMSTGGITNPSAALIKALMINGARDMAPGQYGTGAKQEITARPDQAQGFGHVDLYHTLKTASHQFLDLFDSHSLATGMTNTFTYTVSETSTNKFYVTMVYADYWSTASSGKQLVNDLDVTVQRPSGGYLYANNRASKDDINNVEMIEFAASEIGTYTVRVSARTVPSGSPQPYALVVRGPKNEESPAAPVFGPNPGPVAATVGELVDFEVTASGYPVPDVALRGTTASSGSYDDDGGYCVYEPPAADIGTQTFTFIASNSVGVATQIVSVNVTEAAPAAPASVWASVTNATDFTAAWNAVSNATSYRLDVATNAAFSDGGGMGPEHTNDCAGIGGGVVSSYLPRTWTNDNAVIWNAYLARTDQKVNGAESICLQNKAGAYVDSSTISNGMGRLSFVVQQMFTGSGGQLTVSANNSAVGTFDYDTNVRTAKFENINLSGAVTLVISNNTAARPAIHQIIWTDYGGDAASLIAGYSNRTVNGTSQSVTGLTSATTYYFRVRAVNSGGVSGNSPTGQVTTTTADPFEQWLVTEQGQNPNDPNFAPSADADGDGMTTWEEYLAGTDPADANSVLQLEGEFLPAADELHYTFSANPERFYQLIYATNLAGPILTSNLGWGVPCLVITNNSSGPWFGGVRAWITPP